MEKDKDLFLDMLENPNLTLEDMVSVGHSAESTRFLDKSAYENSQKVRAKFTDAEGNFKQDEFNTWYDTAAKAYQQITSKDNNISLLNVAAFDESDITVSPEKRTLNTKPIVSFTPNPDRLSTSIYRVGKTSERERTQSELAQAEKILLNPVEAAADPSKAKWGDSPNDSWWSNFFDTQVLALWDEDGTHVDPVTGQTVLHQKGELKLNDNGTYYYESLDGRDTYGRQVLNKMNTITTDGSFWNQYDFFDSDDIKEKSFVGSVAKNLALVGSMFIPYVGWGVAGASVATQLVGLTGTLGKMLTGSDSPTFSAMEGWSKSLNRQTAKSEYAQQNMLCWENFIDLIGDTTAQLREQRAIFKFAPAILGKGKYGIQSKAFGANTKAMGEEIADAARKESTSNLDVKNILRAVGGEDPRASLARAGAALDKIISNGIVDKAVKDYLEDYNSLGEKIARAYMVGITVGDTYGEAKEAGASDFEATMLTLGYAAAENKLLNSELGKWIFPELKGQSATLRQIVKKMLEADKELSAEGLASTLDAAGVKKTKAELIGKKIAGMGLDTKNISENLGSVDQNTKTAWMKKWFNAGKDIFDTQLSVMKGTVGAMVSNALAEGTEEVTEELLKDFSTSCFNLVKAAQGDKDTRMQGFLGTWDWNEALKRYGMSFFGGLVGGGINSAATDYSQFRDIANMTSELAMQQLVWMERNGETEKFWNTVSKMALGDKLHTTERDENGNYKLGDKDNNLDIEVKKAIRQLLDLIHNILTVNGANIDDEGLIGQVMNSLPSLNGRDILGDFRANALATSVTAGRFLKEYNNLCKAIVLEANNLRNLQTQNVDSQKPTPDLELAIKESQENLKILQDARQKLLSGERTAEFYKDAMFETTYGVSESFIAPTEVQYMEMITGKPYSLITEEERKPLRDKYANWSKTERAEQIHQLSTMFYDTTARTSKALQESHEMYDQLKNGLLERLLKITDLSSLKLSAIILLAKGYYSENPTEDILNILSNWAKNDPANKANPLNVALDDSTGHVYLTENPKTPGEVEFNFSDSNEQLALDGYLDKYREAIENPNTTTEEKVSNVINTYLDNIVSEISGTADEIIKSGYIHPEVKRAFLPVIEQTFNELNGLSMDLDPDMLETSDLAIADLDRLGEASEKVQKALNDLQEKQDALKTLNYTPISENLRNFAVGLGTNNTVLDLVEGAIKKEESYQEAVDNIILDEDSAKQFDEAEKLLKLYRASIIASGTDNADVDQIFGYNKALNELCKNDQNWTPLAEIDLQIAGYALQDVNLALQRLQAIKGISALNLGNKLNIQNYTAVNTKLILYNKLNTLITNLLNEGDDDAKDLRNKWNQNGALDELKLAIESAELHKLLTGKTVADRTLALNTAQKEQIERESHQIEDAIYNFFLKNKDKLNDSAESRADLALFLKVAKFDYYKHNNDIVTQSSEDIDDNAFTWWLASHAALKSSDFYNAYRKVISDDIAPIPTLEFGVYASIASIYNGDLFKTFGSAMKQYVYEDWKSKSDVVYNEDGSINKDAPSEKYNILKERGITELPRTNEDIDAVLGCDFVPNFNNILFIEGIPGSGKSTGVGKTIVKLLNYLDPKLGDGSKLLDHNIVVSHSTQGNAENFASSLNFKDGTSVTAYGKEELLKWMSTDYKNREDVETGIFNYGPEDVFLGDDGVYHSRWQTRKLPTSDVPSLMFIDEWSRYTQAEIDLINRFASENGIQVIASGDMDQLSPKAIYKTGVKGEPDVELSIARNITPRAPKLGISMRAGNGQKVQNLYALLQWKLHPTKDAIPLYYVETDTDLYGDKVVSTTGELTDKQLQDIKKDLDKMVANLDAESHEKIGYIYHKKGTKLYDLLNSDQYKDKIDFKSEAAAQGREAKYYIVENNRSIELDEMAYHKSLYTGISRAEQASIVIAPSQSIGKLLVKRPTHQENKLIPDNFTTEGIARFSKQRKALLDKIYGDTLDPDLSTIVPRTKEEINVTPSNTKPEPEPEPKKDTEGRKKNPKKEDSKTNIDLSKAQFQKGNVITNGDATLTILDVEPGDNESINYKIDLGSGPVSIAELKLLELGYQVQPPQPKEETIPPAGPSTDTTESSDVEGSTEITGLPAVQEANNTIGSIGDTTESNTPDTTWDATEENMLNVLKAIINSGGVVEGNSKISFQTKAIENILSVNPGDLNKILDVFTAVGSLEETSPGTYKLNVAGLDLAKFKEKAEGDPNEDPLTETPVANYTVGDEFLLKKNEPPYKVTGVFFDLESNSFKYKLTRDALEVIKNESELDALKSADLFTDLKDVIKGDGHTLEPEGPHNFFSLEETEKGLEALQGSEDSGVPELTMDDSGDIQIQMTGHTFNTNYLGCQFDDKGNAVLPQEGEPGAKRIDLANGIVKVTKGRINTKSKLLETIGAIRQAMMFKDLTELEESIKGTLPELKDLKLKLLWAFISKAAIPNKGSRDRFSYDPSQRLDYMTDDEHSDIPIKMVSLLVLDESGACVLEMPLMTLGSPFTALYLLGLIDKENKIYQAYETSVASGKDLHLVLQDVINAIDKEVTAKAPTGGIKPGYKRLQDLCKLWQFTSDGIRFINKVNGKSFNIKDHATNLGVHFVKFRTTELSLNSPKVDRYNYSGKWNDLTEVTSHKDVNYSSIMEFANEYDDDFNRLGPKGHPFVLRSDSGEYKDDESMMSRYLEQLKHPELPKIVKLEFVSPPEIGIYDYLFERSKTLNCHYGNLFSAYRILDAVRNLANKEIWRELKPETRNDAGNLIDRLNAKREELQQEVGENHLLFMSRVYKAQREILDETDGVKILSDALFELTFDYKNGSEGLATFNKEMALKIAKTCEDAKMTGIQYRPVFLQGDPVAGYGYRVKTAQNKYCSEDGKSYRIYSKFDPPIFDLESIAGQISNWANSYTVNGNVYRFNNVSKNDKKTRDYAYDFYMADGEHGKSAEKSPNLKLREKHSSLLEKLGLKDYDALDNIEDESRFLEIIRDKYVETPGNVAVVVDGKKLLYGQLDGVEVEGNVDSPINLKGATQISFKANNTQDSTYTLTIKPANSSENVEIAVEVLAGENKFRLNLGVPETKVDLQPVSDTFDYNPYVEALTTKAATLPPKLRDFYNQAIKAITEGVKASKTKDEITQDIIKVFLGREALAQSFLKRALSEEQAKKLLEPMSTDEKSTETEEKPATCPIFGSLIYN